MRGRSAILPDPSRPGLHVGAQGRDTSETIPLDIVFPVLHGPYGEDGTLQGLLELAGVPYAGAGVAASAVGMDKELMKALFDREGLPQVDYVVARDRAGDESALAAEIEADFAFPVFVKPVNLGSSVGISKAHDRAELVAALRLAFAYDRKVIVEASVDAREIECGAMGNERVEISAFGEIVPAAEFYDYQAKYADAATALVIPADITPDQETELRRVAAAAYRAIDCAGFARCDFFIDRADGRVLLNELNTIPGMTDVSLFPKVWEASGVPYPELVDRLVGLALSRHAARVALRTSRDSV